MRIQNEPIFDIFSGGALFHIVLLIVVIEVVIRLVTGRGVSGADGAGNSAQRRLKGHPESFPLTCLVSMASASIPESRHDVFARGLQARKRRSLR
jgi:hypothetical protein